MVTLEARIHSGFESGAEKPVQEKRRDEESDQNQYDNGTSPQSDACSEAVSFGIHGSLLAYVASISGRTKSKQIYKLTGFRRHTGAVFPSSVPTHRDQSGAAAFGHAISGSSPEPAITICEPAS